LGTPQGYGHPTWRHGCDEVVKEEAMNEDDFNDTLQAFSTMLEEEDPKISEIFAQMRAGELTEQEAMRLVMEHAVQNPTWGEEVESKALEAFQPMYEVDAIEHLPDRADILERWGMEEEDLIYIPGENRAPMLHPLVQGMIGELLQFDDDVPELRTGRMPEGVKPAVPVKTKSRNPVMIGAMLKQASEEVLAELQSAERDQAKALEDAIESGNNLAVKEIVTGSMAISVPGYEAGKAPAHRAVAQPPSQDIAKLSFKEKQELFTKALTSTQGRKSAAPVIADLVRDALRQSQIETRMGKKPSEDRDQRTASWTVEIYGTNGEMNPNFAYIDVAARAIARRLLAELGQKPIGSSNLALHVRPINQVNERIVGWEASIY
jgi:hypothetical protein